MRFTIVLVDSDVRPVHALDDLPVDPPGGDAELSPDCLPLDGGLPDKRRASFLSSEFTLKDLADLERQRPDVLAVRHHPEVKGQRQELLLVLDLKARERPLGRLDERLDHRPRVVGVGRGARGDRPKEIPGGDRLGVHAADAGLGRIAEGVDLAGAHRTVPATDTHDPVPALGGLLIEPVPAERDVIGGRLLDER